MLFEEAYKNLNKAQKEAVDTIDGPVMVIAGPGTGKTQVLALRIGNILTKTDTPPDGILCLTFTNSGVEAMRKRLYGYIGTSAGRVEISTFHSFASKIIEEFFHALGFAHPPKALEEADIMSLVDSILNTNEWKYLRPRGNTSMYFRDLKSIISLLKRERMSPEDFKIEIEKEIETLKNDPSSISSRGESKGRLKKEIETKIENLEKTIEVVSFYELYEKEKEEQELMDYDDILSHLVTLVRESDEVRDTIRERYLYALIDEHQDSSGVQNEFIKLVWGDVEKPNVFVVGDDRQLIYGFGGATIEHFEEFKNTFSGVRAITLTENYRSTQTILDTADILLESTLAKGKLKSQSEEKHPILLVECDYPRDEIIRAGLFFKEKIESGIPENECALLVPKNYHVRSAIAVLKDMGLFVSAHKTLNLFDTQEFYFIHTVLSILHNPFNNTAVAESLLDVHSGVPPLVAHQFLSESYTRKLSVSVLLEAGSESGLLQQTNPIYLWGKKLEESIKGGNGKSVYEIIQHIGKDFLLNIAKDHESYVRRIEVIRSMLHLALTLEEKKNRVTLETYLEFVNRLIEYGEHIPLAMFVLDNGVKVMTLHGSKGLEFDTVWIAHMNERSLMSSKKMGFSLPESIKEKIEEKNELVARRELYVAVTRAKRFCALSYARISHKGSDERLASIVEAMPKEQFTFLGAEINQKEISKSGLGQYVASERKQENGLKKEELKELVRDKYSSVKVSVTLLNNFFECPWKWYFRNFLKVPEPLADSLVFGSIVHGSIEQILKNEAPQSKKDLENIIEKEIKKCHIVDERSITRFQKDALVAVGRFMDDMLPTLWDKREAEKAISYKDPELPDIMITGKIDLIENDDGDSIRVTDFKTGKTRKKSEIEKEDDNGKLSSYLRQLAMYTYLLEQSTKGRVSVESSRLYFLEDGNSKNALYETSITHEHVDLLREDMKEYDREMKSGVWTDRECNFKPWGSGEAECPYCKMAEMYK